MTKYDDPLARTMYTKDIVKKLRTDIILGKYKRGTRLIESKIAEQMGISRAPVRTSLQLLSQEGLVLSLSNGGTEVVGFSTRYCTDLFNLRLTLELQAVETLLASPTFHYRPIFDMMEQFEQLMNEKTEITSGLTSQLDIQFHRSLLIMSGNQPLLVAWNTMANILQAVLEITNMTKDSFTEFYEDHRRIVDLIIQRNPKCLDELREHITIARNIITDRISKTLED
ncbi:GntR family transcriptional regulator [Paenibacillus spongiae]|uniref:GntR family transcriptional regulator n=1 Tax=Paenibacillus spongiae TaxID=2909671 RepID=A0ABY5S3M3_9BACL|nr:GntR family transcriptional regulator [Paenibacillus spongiae]UVI28294.1 GntR family transcriptional regulator [Paenibacillus spongiae]